MYGLALMTKYGGYTEASAKQVCRDAMKDIIESVMHIYYYQF